MPSWHAGTSCSPDRQLNGWCQAVALGTRSRAEPPTQGPEMKAVVQAPSLEVPGVPYRQRRHPRLIRAPPGSLPLRDHRHSRTKLPQERPHGMPAAARSLAVEPPRRPAWLLSARPLTGLTGCRPLGQAGGLVHSLLHPLPPLWMAATPHRQESLLMEGVACGVCGAFRAWKEYPQVGNDRA